MIENNDKQICCTFTSNLGTPVKLVCFAFKAIHHSPPPTLHNYFNPFPPLIPLFILLSPLSCHSKPHQPIPTSPLPPSLVPT